MPHHHNCMSCNQPMRLLKKIKRNSYWIRRFYCDICDITETIYADGERDINIEVLESINDIKQMYIRDEKNEMLHFIK